MIGVFKRQRKFRNKGFSNWDFSIVILLGSRDCRLSESLVWIKVPTVQQERIDIEFMMVFRRTGELLKLRCHLTLIRISGVESLKQDLRSWRPRVSEEQKKDEADKWKRVARPQALPHAREEETLANAAGFFLNWLISPTLPHGTKSPIGR